MPPTFADPELSLEQLLAELRSSDLDIGSPVSTSIVVLDTFDGRLHDAGLRLTFVSAPERALVLDAGGGAPQARLASTTAPEWPSELPPGPFRTRLAAVTQERALVPLARIHAEVTSARQLDQRGKAIVHVRIHDRICVDAATAEGPSWFAEVVPVAGHDKDAGRVARRLTDLGLRRIDGDSVTAIASAAGVDITGHDSSPTVPLEPDLDALVAFRRVLLHLLDTIELNVAGTIDDVDPEFLHELRVAVRRTRSVLTEGKKVLPPDVRGRYRESFGWMQDVTGPPRDYDVYVIGWDDYVAPLDEFDADALERVRTEIEQRRRAAHRDLAASLRSDTFDELLTGWRSWLESDAPAEVGFAVGPHLASRIEKAQDKVLRDGRAITPESEAERLHDLRKDTKRLRYLLECFGSLFPAKRRKAFVRQLKALQDNLGDHQDAEVHLAQLRLLARDLHQRPDVDTDVLLAMGRLSDHLDRRRREERHEFAERFAAYDTKANRAALSDLLQRVRSS